MSSIFYIPAKLFIRYVTSLYYKRIDIIGLENIPKEGPIIICGNHNNQFMDAMLLIAHCPRPLSFCFAASSFSKPVIGFFAKKIDVIPVYRSEDQKQKSKGKIKFISPTQIEGVNTQFISEIKDNPNFKLGLGSILVNKKHSFSVLKVESETKMELKSNNNSYEELQKEENKLFEFFYLPKMDNSTMYKESHEKLRNNKAICIFPEGTSHDRTNFIKLKAGVAFMILGSMAEHDVKNIKVVPAGLTYFRREEFRSEVILEYGKPLIIPNELGELYKKDKKSAIEKTLNLIENSMKTVTITASSHKEYQFLNVLRDLYIPKGMVLPTESYGELSRRLGKIYDGVKEKKETKKLKNKIMRYMEELENVGMLDKDVKSMKFSYGYFFRRSIVSFILFHLYLILSIPMILITAPFIWLITKKAEKERIAAKAKNPMKINALDIVSSIKVTSFAKYSFPIFILWFIFLVMFFNYIIGRYVREYYKRNYGTSIRLNSESLFFRNRFGFLGGDEFKIFEIFIMSAITFPFYLYFSTFMIDNLFFYLDIMKMRFIFFCYPKNVYKLKSRREMLVIDVIDYVNLVVKGTEYEKNRIIRKGKTNKEYQKICKELKKFLYDNNL